MIDSKVEVFLEHQGVKGMKWGVRKDNSNGVSRKTNREARKDAEEYARAKMYYGQGAGIRRKLINKSIEAKKAKDPAYAKAFESHLKNQDYSVHASKARKERSHTDRKDKAKKSTAFVARKITKEQGTQAAFTALILGGTAFLASPKGRAILSKGLHTAESAIKQKRGAAVLNAYFKRNMA